MTPDLPTIRPYRHDDEEVVVDLWGRASRIAHPFIPGEGTGERERKIREVYLVQADNWVAETRAHGVVGLLGMLGSEIGGLFVDPEVQGIGIGRALVDHALNLHGTVTLEVYERNSAARGFYAHLGFEEIGRRLEEETAAALITLRLSATGRHR